MEEAKETPGLTLVGGFLRLHAPKSLQHGVLELCDVGAAHVLSDVVAEVQRVFHVHGARGELAERAALYERQSMRGKVKVCVEVEEFLEELI